MSFSIARTIRHVIAPNHQVSCSWLLWQQLTAGLRLRGRSATRESGAFLLGMREMDRARVLDFVFYDDLDPHSLDSGIVMFGGKHFPKLWTICRERKIGRAHV